MLPFVRMDPHDLPRFEGWETIEKLGEGGMCVVYRGRPLGADGGPERAIKVLNDTSAVSIRRFVDEAALLQRIDHPNVVRVHALAAEARPPWLVMDLLAGRDLEETMKLEGRMDPERAARLFADLASGLAAVHAAGVRHRDIKPANIRLGSDGVARLIDFGIARDAKSARRTRQGFVVGTASYLPPEIFSDEDRGDNLQDTETADVYALGQTLCEILVGAPIHDTHAGTAAGLMVRVMKDKLEREHLDPRDLGAKVPDDLCEIVRRATAREPEVRTATARQLEDELRAWLQTRNSAAMVAPVTRVDLADVPVPTPPPAPRRSLPPPVPSPPTIPPQRRGPGVVAMGAVGAMGMAGVGLVVLGLVILLALGVGALVAFRPTPPPPDPRDGVLQAVDQLQGSLAGCHQGTGSMTLSLTVSAGKVSSLSMVKSTVDRRAERCVERILSTATYPAGDPVTVEVPVVFR
jgi:serine/threonine-protein kinase